MAAAPTLQELEELGRLQGKAGLKHEYWYYCLSEKGRTYRRGWKVGQAEATKPSLRVQ